MTKGTTQEIKMHYKGPTTGDDYVIYITSAEAARNWTKDKTIPLVDVLDAFYVFVSHKQGAQGILDRASNAQLESEFGSSKVEEVVQVILEKGQVIMNKVCLICFPPSCLCVSLVREEVVSEGVY